MRSSSFVRAFGIATLCLGLPTSKASSRSLTRQCASCNAFFAQRGERFLTSATQLCPARGTWSSPFTGGNPSNVQPRQRDTSATAESHTEPRGCADWLARSNLFLSPVLLSASAPDLPQPAFFQPRFAVLWGETRGWKKCRLLRSYAPAFPSGYGGRFGAPIDAALLRNTSPTRTLVARCGRSSARSRDRDAHASCLALASILRRSAVEPDLRASLRSYSTPYAGGSNARLRCHVTGPPAWECVNCATRKALVLMWPSPAEDTSPTHCAQTVPLLAYLKPGRETAVSSCWRGAG